MSPANCSLTDKKHTKKGSGWLRAPLFTSILLISIAARAQHHSQFSGKVFDASTNKPIPFAVVYFANTALGSYTTEDGSFLIENIPNGKYSLTISMLGYKTYSQPVYFDGISITLPRVALQPDAIKLQEVVVKAKNAKYNRYYKTFKQLFIGETPNATHCSIANPDDIFVDYNEKDRVLRAYASEPIEIINSALGYRIFYKLDNFEANYRTGVYSAVGIPRFENMKAESERQQKRWIQARDNAYYGSLNHFMRSLKQRKLTENHFTIAQLTNKAEVPLLVDSLFAKGSDNVVRFKGIMKVVFDAEQEDFRYTKNYRYSSPQRSYLTFKENQITIYENGYYESILAVMQDGYLGWTDRIADMVPIEYQPTGKLKE